MRYAFDHEGRRYFVNLEEHAEGPRFVVEGTAFTPKVERVDKGRYKVTVDDETFEFRVEGGHVHMGRDQVDLRVRRAKPELIRAGGKRGKGDGRIKPPMPGKVVEVQVKVGDEVEEGSPLLVLEAMKMQNDLKSPMEGVVTQVHVKDGQNVESSTIMLEIEPRSEE